MYISIDSDDTDHQIYTIIQVFLKNALHLNCFFFFSEKKMLEKIKIISL